MEITIQTTIVPATAEQLMFEYEHLLNAQEQQQMLQWAFDLRCSNPNVEEFIKLLTKK